MCTFLSKAMRLGDDRFHTQMLCWKSGGISSWTRVSYYPHPCPGDLPGNDNLLRGVKVAYGEDYIAIPERDSRMRLPRNSTTECTDEVQDAVENGSKCIVHVMGQVFAAVALPAIHSLAAGRRLGRRRRAEQLAQLSPEQTCRLVLLASPALDNCAAQQCIVIYTTSPKRSQCTVHLFI